MPWALTSLGAGTTSVLLEVETGKIHIVSLIEHGMPSDAIVLSATYTGQGGKDGAVTVLEFHNNLPLRRIPGTSVSLYGIPLGEGTLPRVGAVAISVVWIRSKASDAWLYLTTAFEAATSGQHGPALVFAQAAVEIAMMPLIAAKFRKYASADNLKSFMNDALSYSHALNVMLPFLCGQSAIAKMPDEVRGSLNRLRKLRNNIIHEGIRSDSIPNERVAEGLCAAMFGFEYVRFIEGRL